MKACEVSVGEWFVGSMDRGTLQAALDAKGKKWEIADGADIYVSARCAGEADARVMMNALSELPRTHECQIQSSDGLWVCGQREKRSQGVRIKDWRSPFPGGARLTYLLDLYKVLSRLGPSAQVSAMREYREAENYAKEQWPDEFDKFEELWLPERRRP